jgi:hypothetical protein
MTHGRVFDDFIAKVDAIDISDPTPPVPMHTPLQTAWGVTVTLTHIHEGFATTPVEYINGVITTPIATLYRLEMAPRDKGKLSAHLQRRLCVLPERYHSAHLNLTLPELGDALALPPGSP